MNEGETIVSQYVATLYAVYFGFVQQARVSVVGSRVKQGKRRPTTARSSSLSNKEFHRYRFSTVTCPIRGIRFVLTRQLVDATTGLAEHITRRRAPGAKILIGR